MPDRINRQVAVYALDGDYKRSFWGDFLSSPSGFVTHGEYMVVAELRARLAVLGGEDNLICYLGENEAACSVEGWPNNKNENWQIVPTAIVEPGKFNSPHGMAVDSQGNLFIAEWLIGRRFTKLARL